VQLKKQTKNKVMENGKSTLERVQQLKSKLIKEQQYENAALLRDIEKCLETSVPFIDEVEEFNKTFGKPVNYEPTIPERKEWMFVYDFIREELEEYKEACEKGDIVEILDALCDITYVSLANGALLHGLKNKILPAYAEVQASNMSKACQTEEDAIATTKSEALRIGEETYYEQVGDKWVIYRKSDKKVLKSLKYFRPNLKQFFTEDELNNVQK